MKAVIIDEYGDNGVVRIVDVDRPEPGPGEVLVRIHAAGINPVDWKIRNGAGQRLGMTLPIHLGSEIAGTIEALGAGVDEFFVGDAIYGIIKSGGFAEYAVTIAADLSRKPAGSDFLHAAAVPLGALTAWQAMFDVAGLCSGQRLLITNGSGGVGSLAIQLAKTRGAHVTAMASGRNEAFVRSLGADAVIDYTTQPLEQMPHDMDVVFDLVGGDTFQRAFATLKGQGFMVTSVAFPSDEATRHGVSVERVLCKPNGHQLGQIRNLVETGSVKPTMTKVLPLASITEALQLSESGHTRGKIVVQIVA